MEITFAPSFWKSLKKITRHNTWWYKTYQFIRRDLWIFFKNIWKFRKELYKHRNWDSAYSLGMFRRSLEEVCYGIEHYGPEVTESRLKKIEKMKRAIQILKWHEKDPFIDLAEEQLGYEVDFSHGFNKEPEEIRLANKVIFDLAKKIEEDSWIELFEILKGQDIKDYFKFIEENKLKDSDDRYNSWFDGSGMKGWWW